jgi:hypothetical protein
MPALATCSRPLGAVSSSHGRPGNGVWLGRRDSCSATPLQALAHVAAGLRDVDERAKPQLPAAWEAVARQLLLRPDVEAALEVSGGAAHARAVYVGAWHGHAGAARGAVGGS